MKIIRAAQTDLPTVALQQLGDARFWSYIAKENGLFDPIITDPVDLIIPDLDPSAFKGAS